MPADATKDRLALLFPDGHEPIRLDVSWGQNMILEAAFDGEILLLEQEPYNCFSTNIEAVSNGSSPIPLPVRNSKRPS